jgi:hypothetical protein
LREAAQHQQRLEQAAERLCRALEASQLLFLQVSAGTGEPRHGHNRLTQLGDFKALGLSQAPPAAAPGRQPRRRRAVRRRVTPCPAGRTAGERAEAGAGSLDKEARCGPGKRTTTQGN